MVENSNGTDDSSNNIINDAEQPARPNVKRKRPLRPRLKWIDALRQGSSDLPTMSARSLAMVDNFRVTRLRKSFKDTAAALLIDRRMKGLMVEVDLTGLDGGLSRDRQQCSCASLMVTWRHTREPSLCIITSTTADYQRVEASQQYVQMTHVHLRFDETGAGDDMLLSPTYSPVPRVRTNGTELEGGGPARGIPETVAAMSPFAIQQNSSVDEVQIFLSTFEGGTSTLISPLKWNQSMNQNMKSTFYNYLRDYIYS